ncbi:16435_t:CDS:2 [Cetraspora pellucida]|uniref:16435_t:CDS:1 n=1 Tax=Cetraspora pellucida TaxID=1433469 RepID=A0ACA9P0D6_9GLOM|nr:16435_t:CDS:2 [Cetraspora pellucida]
MASTNSQNNNGNETTSERINVENINEYLGDFLQTSQPTYDPKIIERNPYTFSNKTSDTSTPKNSKTTSFFDFFKSPIHLTDIFSPSSITQDSSLSEQEKLKQQRRTTQAKIKEIGQDFWDRKKEIYDATLINCSEVHTELQECFKKGKLWDRLTLCINMRDKFWNCMEQQKKFLSDMGYASPLKTEAENEEILHKADINYRQMSEKDKTT